jgi:MoaA/NifB/PqqE/SkfB family radical SAM enzyme
MPILKPLALRKSDIPMLEAQIALAQQICRNTDTCIINSINIEYEDAETEPLDKETHLRYLENIDVIRGIPVYPLKESAYTLEHSKFWSYPPVLSELVGEARARRRALNAAEPPPAYRVPLANLDELRNKLDFLVFKIKQVPPETLRVPYCMSAWVKFFVEADAGVRPCDPWKGRITDLLNVTTFEEAWHSPSLVQLRKGTVGEAELSNHCQQCKFSERHLYLDEFFHFIKSIGIDPDVIIPQERSETLGYMNRQRMVG